MQFLRFLPAALIALLFTANVAAFVPPIAMGNLFPPSVQGSTVTFGAGTASSQNIGGASVGTTGGNVEVHSKQGVGVGGGNTVGVTVKARPDPKEVAKAIGKFLGKALGPAAVVYGVFELCEELGYSCGLGSSGNVTVGKTVTTGTLCAEKQVCYDPGAWLDSSLGPTHIGAFSRVAYENEYGVYVQACGTKNGNFVCGGPYFMGSASTTVKDASLQELEDAIAAKSGWPDSSSVGKVLKQAISSGIDMPVPSPYGVTGPEKVYEAPSTTTYPDGSKQTTTTQKDLTYGTDKVTATTTTTTTKTDPTGATTPVSETSSPQPVTAAPAEQEKPKDPCGLPDTPACIVDGSGAPTAEELPEDAAKKSLDPVQDFLKKPFDLVPALPTINWAFALPTACGNIPTPAFAPYLTGVDVCQFQPMFHELMSMVWMLGGLFGAISLFMRSSLAD